MISRVPVDAEFYSSVLLKNKTVSYFTSKMGSFGNNRELQFGTSMEKPEASPQNKGEGLAFLDFRRKLVRVVLNNNKK